MYPLVKGYPMKFREPKIFFRNFSLLILLAAAWSIPAEANVTCKILTDNTTSGMRPRCPCSPYQVDCGSGRVGWVDTNGKVLDKSGGNITFGADSIDLYSDTETWS